MTISNSPTTPFILVPDATQDRDLVLKTQPFYSMFFHTETQTNTSYPNRVRQKMKIPENKTPDGNSCRRAWVSGDPRYLIYKRIPFTSLGIGRMNLYFLMIVFIATIILGAVAFSYWVYLLGDNVLDDHFKKVVRKRSVYLSVFFIVSFIFLSLILYEYFTLKFISLPWFTKYQQTDEPSNFYDFLLNTRKIVLWVFLLILLTFVLFITIAISKRPNKFKNQIAINISIIVLLFCAQYFYSKADRPLMKSFCLALNVFCIGLIAYLLYPH